MKKAFLCFTIPLKHVHSHICTTQSGRLTMHSVLQPVLNNLLPDVWYFIDVKFYYSRQIFYEYIVTCVFCANGDFDKKLCSKQKKGTKKTT